MKMARILRDVTALEAVGDWSGPMPNGDSEDTVWYPVGAVCDLGTTCGGKKVVYLPNNSDWWFLPEDAYEVIEVRVQARMLRDVLSKEIVGGRSKKVWYKAGELYDVHHNGWVYLADHSDWWFPPDDSYERVVTEEVAAPEA